MLRPDGRREAEQRVLLGAGGLSEVLDTLVASIEEVVGGGAIGSVLVLDDDEMRLRNGAAPHLPTEYCNAIDGLPVGPKAGSCGTAVFRRERVIVSDIAHDPLWEDYRAVARLNGLAACWSTPILSRDGRVLGSFAMYYPSPRQPEPNELALVDIFARTAAAAIERARADVLREQAVHAADAARADAEAARADLEWLLDAIEALNSQLSYGDGFEFLAHRAVPRLADVAVIDVVERGRVARRLAVCDDPLLADVLFQWRDRPSFGDPQLAVARSGRPAIREIDLTDFTGDRVDPELVRVLGAIGAREMMVVPLVSGNETLGVLSLIVGGERRCDQQTLALASGLAWRAALAIDNTRLLAVREQAVTDLQRGLLPPSLPTVAGLDVGANYQPVAEDLLVGGDFYDFFALDHGWAFMIGDICGTGAAAASMTSLVRHTARALARVGVEPAEVLRQVNQSMIELGDEEKFVTMIMGFVSVNAQDACVRLVSAGHPPALAISPDGKVVRHGGGGTLLGQLDDITVTDETFTLAAGTSLVLHTDGLFEARTDSGEQFGHARLIATAATLAGRTSKEIAAGLTRAVLPFADDQTVDDIAVLVLTPTAADGATA